MKTVYFIRHGESEGNVGPLRQSASTGLTERGRLQARLTADRCATLPVEALVSSTMTRAYDTALIIGEEIGQGVISSDLFVERRRPSLQTGARIDDPYSLEIDRILWDNFARLGFRHSDEENFDDLKLRAEQALAYLADRTEEHIVVVTHGLFMRIVTASIMFGERLTGRDCEPFMRALQMENTGLSIFHYDAENKELPWKIWAWNDHTHLA